MTENQKQLRGGKRIKKTDKLTQGKKTGVGWTEFLGGKVTLPQKLSMFIIYIWREVHKTEQKDRLLDTDEQEDTLS